MPLVWDQDRIGAGRRPAPTRIVAAVVGVVVLGAIIATVAAGDDPVRSEQSQRADALAYVAAVEPLAREAGRVIQLGMKPGVEDARHERRDGDAIARAAESNERELTSLRARWAQVDAPDELSDAHATFLAALQGYADAAVLLAEAARAPTGSRAALLDRVVATGEANDDVWDRAAVQVQAHLRALELPTVTWLPGSARQSP